MNKKTRAKLQYYDSNAEEFERSSVETADEMAMQMECFYLKKISIYKCEYEENLDKIEAELMDTRESLLAALEKINQMKSKIKELEAKNTFYKNRIQTYENNKKPDNETQ